MSSYPVRPKFFAQKFIRLLTKTAAAMEIGADGAWLLAMIVAQEDAKRYTGPVNYWNEQLFGLMGCASKKPLVKARRKCVDAGWLHYVEGGKGKAGRYWVTIPPAYQDLTDGACDESEDLSVPFGTTTGTTNGTDKTSLGCQMEPAMERQRNGNGSTSLPNPNPNPNTDASLFPEVAFDEFWNAYPARNGKKLEKARAVKAFAKINSAEHTNVMQAVRNLTASGQHPKDAFRFLADSWREWVTAPSAGPSETHRTQIIKRAKPMEIPHGS